MPTLPTAAVGAFRLHSMIGTGTTGEVYLATDVDGRRAAVKLLAAVHAGNSIIRARFLREVEALRRIRHRNVIALYDYGELDGRPYFAMELLDGGNAQRLIDGRGFVAAAIAAAIGAQAARGLAEASRVGVTHRDVKPANLGLTRRGTVKVVDFGLARLSDASVLTGHGIIVGTPDYTAPEQVLGTQLDDRTDVYALACTIFHLATGRVPYPRPGGDAHVHLAVLRDHVEAPVPRTRSVAAQIDRALDDIVFHAMSKQGRERPSLDEMADRLESVAARLRASRR